MVPRTTQYAPTVSGFICFNGNNRYTRALYGSNTDYRIETSDKPIFALYKSKVYRNVRFFINNVQLDEVESCIAYYANGCRHYKITDKRWGNSAELEVYCVAMSEEEGCYWHFSAKNFLHTPTLTMKMCDIANPKLRRNGDIGADKAGSFEPAPTESNLVIQTLSFTDEAFAIANMVTPSEGARAEHNVILSLPNEKLTKAYNTSKTYFEELSQRVIFKTPEPWLNPLGSTLTLAADGAWDGETWLHGAIGWRMPLAGWRAGYLGDVLGWNDRAVSHFDAYANSQVTNVPATIDSPSQDPEQNLARAEKKWGTQMYSNGYICRNPNKNNQMHHYDMNLNYMDELLWHFQYDADTAYMRKMWPVITSHLAWEKRNFDKDDNHLYDAYCCIWASDALYYNGGEVTHSTAYNYRGNLLAAKIARIIGEDATPYQQEADAILKAMNERLWTGTHWAEYRDVMGLQRLHPNAALWSVYTPIDCGVGTPQQMYSCTRYVDKNIPHISVETPQGSAGYLISTSNWMPYSWSINNVASAEIMHTALSFFEAGRAKEGMNLIKANIMDQMYLGCSPGNLGQISYYDAARGESYRDFGDNIGISARAIVQGVFGIVPQALDGKVIIRPGFPLEWDSCEVKTPYLSYTYKRVNDKAVFTIEQNFTRPLQVIVRVNTEGGRYIDYEGSDSPLQFVGIDVPQLMKQEVYKPEDKTTVAYDCNIIPEAKKQTSVEIPFNASVTDIFRNEYVSPRPQSTSLEIPIQGIGEWCHPKFTVDINDSTFRAKAVGNKFTAKNLTFATPQEGKNILFASLWDNYPNEVSVPLKKAANASAAVMLLAGSTNHMQMSMENARIVAEYTDGTTDTLTLVPPYNYCPIEQDYFIDGKAFSAPGPRP
ncbi:MAG: DUF4450 domain-containing protein, partial [Prevotella sp.]|nr:DUF4450 domain-containing protein [Candidatus Prevotella equi]